MSSSVEFAVSWPEVASMFSKVTVSPGAMVIAGACALLQDRWH
jgi:hypothetical protein